MCIKMYNTVHIDRTVPHNNTFPDLYSQLDMMTPMRQAAFRQCTVPRGTAQQTAVRYRALPHGIMR
jgi:hypothetical protein